MSSMALQWHWPAISHITTWEKTHHLWSWIFQRAHLSSFLIIMPLCPTLMSMLVMSPCPPYLMAKADQCLVTVLIQGYLRLQHVCQVVLGNATELPTTPVTYSGFFSHSQQPEDIKPRSTVGVFPIFFEKAASMAMQKHAILMAKKAIEFVNPGQVPVIVGDCPLYALQKKCQWKYPDEVGESKMVCFMGFLHVEIVSQECGGNLLAGSWWDLMFFQAKDFTSGVTVSILGGKHVKRTRYAYQLTLVWLHALRVQAYNEYCQEEWGPHVSMEMWEKNLAGKSLTICYWTTMRDYLLTNYRFVRGQRMGDWPLTLSACDELCPWFFTFGHTNSARWMPVFLKDMACLPETHPSIYNAFMEGKFVVQRGEKKLSHMALDQSQEHSIKF